MLHQWWFFILPLVCSLQFGIIIGKFAVGRELYKNGKALRCQSIRVDKSGHGNFSTIQSAIDAVPSYNREWICIHIKAGIYREKVNIPYDKPYIYLRGEAKRRTKVIWGDHDNTAQSTTFSSLADNIIVRSITFVNSYNFPLNDKPILPAVAAMVAGDKTIFYRCGFSGFQDTLWDNQGRHYFKQCTIQGSVDFIFGSGQSIYEGCAIQVLGGGFITAQGRTSSSETNGFVFKRCNVFGTGSTFLGRPWRNFSRVLFYKSNLSSVVDPRGWDVWDFNGQENYITFAEHGNYGEGADTSERVRWEKKLSDRTLQELTSMSFIN